MADQILNRPGFKFIAELPGEPVAVAMFGDIPIICTHDGPPCIFHRNPDGSVQVVPIYGTTPLNGAVD